MVLGLIFAVVLAKGSVLKALAMILIGLLLSMVGSDLETGAGRMTFDLPELADGIGFANIAHGRVRLRGNHPQSRTAAGKPRHPACARSPDLMPTRQDLIKLRRRDRARHRDRLACSAFCRAAAR